MDEPVIPMYEALPPLLYQQPSPFLQYLGAPLPQDTTGLASNIVTLRPYIQSLESEVASLDAAIQRLTRHYEKASAHLHLHKGLLCRAHDLPTEILCQIFLYCLENTRDGRGSYDLLPQKHDRNGRSAPWDLTAVCHRWREVGLSMPRLWSAPSFVLDQRIHFNRNEDQTRWNCLTTALSRTREEPLTLDIDLDGRNYPSKRLSDLKDVFPSVGTMYLTGHPGWFRRHASDQNIFPKLWKVGFTVVYGEDDFDWLPDGVQTLDWNTVLSIVGPSPPLRELTLDINTDRGVSPAEEDISLNLSEIPFSLGELTTLNLRTTSTVAIVPLLRACTSLSTLSIDGMYGDESDYDGPMITMPNLQTLRLSNLEPTIPEYFQCPRLLHLAIDRGVSWSLDIFERILSNSHCVLETLRLHIACDVIDAGYTEEPRESTFSLCKNLKVLTLYFDYPCKVENLEDILNACVYKSDGSVLPILTVRFLSDTCTNLNAEENAGRQALLHASVQRWREYGVHVTTS
ncbi:hypothetical protein CYLTODRAFT_426189 [Cylindrobasidium torrendii FP15055 ss-10]|uniref:Uncharacterized protein n=1 Tax=Cylindrobasidium torrendii FP15055 ss-10 TaxID=1314674 RepID=A0A0D7AZE2_9AGAR|nr:hypothetical protein CYLTODRAFT_426189 [Cylindrobasidium torrendii FP15055 ss-10]